MVTDDVKLYFWSSVWLRIQSIVFSLYGLRICVIIHKMSGGSGRVNLHFCDAPSPQFSGCGQGQLVEINRVQQSHTQITCL